MKAKSRYVSPTYKIYELYADDVITASGENQPGENWSKDKLGGWDSWTPIITKGI